MSKRRSAPLDMVPLGAFWCAATGKQSGRKEQQQADLSRWGIPFDMNAGPRKPAVSALHLDRAKQTYEQEVEAAAVSLPPAVRRRRRRATAGDDGVANVVAALVRIEMAISRLADAWTKEQA
jgi:hypothetical protein